jgi:hypothetical protein
MSVFLITGADAPTRHRHAAANAGKYLQGSPADFRYHPDAIAIIPETSITIADIRAVIRRLSQGSLSGGATVAVLEDFHLATIEAQNAFLKTLEEPPTGCVIILTAVSADMILPTVVSRVIEIRLSAGEGETKPPSELLPLLLSQPVQSRLFLDRLVGSRDEAVDQLTDLLTTANVCLIRQKSRVEMDRYRKILAAVQIAIKQLKKNANLRLTLATALEQMEV